MNPEDLSVLVNDPIADNGVASFLIGIYIKLDKHNLKFMIFGIEKN
jgi:hypothetical protein